MSSQLQHWNKVAIWGAALSGSACMELLAERNIETSFFIDKYPPHDRRFKECHVYSSQEIFDNIHTVNECDCVILTMGAGAVEIKNRLRQLGCNVDIVTYRQGLSIDDILATEKRFTPFKTFKYDAGEQDNRILKHLAKGIAEKGGRWGIYGAGDFCHYFLSQLPQVQSHIRYVFDDDPAKQGEGVVDISPPEKKLLNECDHIFIAATRYLDDLDIKHRLNNYQGDVYDIELLLMENEKIIPDSAYLEPEFSIYPIDIPPIEVQNDLDMLLLDLPGRMLGMLPNGLGYVHNIIKRTGVNFQTLDLDMIIYHRYHSNRILDGHEVLYSKTGREMPADPWAIAFIEDSWKDPEFINYFDELMESTALKIISANPKILGISLNGSNTLLAKNLVKRIKRDLPDIKIVVGGYECINPEVGPKVFQDFDYMVIFEAEGSLEPLIEKIMKGEKVKKLPGVISKDEDIIIGNTFIPGMLVNELDPLGYPTYEWADISLYKNYNGYQLVPILLSRGCRWSKCTFCGERFAWRRRSAQNLVDEIEFLVSKGCNNFHFNDSDLSGDPAAVREICEEIVRRGITGITMAGQLRVQKGYTPDYFEVLKKAGFNYLRYGIDGWSRNTLRLHKKGYNPRMINELLKMTKDAGILVAINLVLGIPYETEEDIDETIENMISNANNLDTIENINTLMLIAGSVYWEKPEELGMRFRSDRKKLYQQYPKYIPYEHWYSVEPYIDQDVRLERLSRVLDAAEKANIRVGSYAEWSSKNAEKV